MNHDIVGQLMPQPSGESDDGVDLHMADTRIKSGLVDVGVTDLMRGMHSRIRPPGHGHMNAIGRIMDSQHRVDGGFQLPLHRAQGRLPGPSMKFRTIVGQINT